ncbi:AI-2E family transporter [Thiohalorhabdus sp. Cl-TMA]|uniref:AI-2E family transporter n=1 Tax=Thiohalorhabdus methylotrophus TaxID=3242694 RepID=A0ABV4TUL6_9GAMM
MPAGFSYPSGQAQKIALFLLAAITAILVGGALKATYIVTMPLAVAFFIAILVLPFQNWLSRILPDRLWWLSIIATMLGILIVVGALITAMWYSFGAVLDKAPQYADTVQQYWEQIQAWAKRKGLPLQETLRQTEGISSTLIGFLTSSLASFWIVAGMLVLVFFLVLLMLLESKEWRVKVRRGLGFEESAATVEAVDAIAFRVRQYLLVKTAVSLLSGVSAGLWLWLMDVDFALLWGLLTFLLNYLPNIGSIIAVFPPTILAFIQFGLWGGLIVVGGLTLIEQILGNLVGPRLEGRTLAISPMVVLVSIVFWGWVWGVVGALIGVLLTTTIIIICDQIPTLRPVAILLRRAETPPSESSQ